MKYLLMWFTAVFMAGCASKEVLKTKAEIVEASKKGMSHLSVKAFRLRQQAKERFVLIDVRTEKEFESGHIEGAVWVPRGKLEFELPKLYSDPEVQLVLYCRSGARSALAVKALSYVGYKNVIDIDGGIKAWKAAGFPLSR